MPCALICESQRHVSRLLQVNLERQGYQVRASQTGDSCLNALRKHSIDLLVIGEPDGMTANEVLSVIQEDPTIEVKVLVLRK